jgi:glycerate 2-kinase
LPGFSILSDVVGDLLDTIASGLTTDDPTTYQDARAIIRKYDLETKLPFPVIKIIQWGAENKLAETPKANDKIFSRVHNILIGTNYNSLLAASGKAEALGYHPIILSSQLIGEAKEVAKFFAGIGRDVIRHGLLVNIPACIIGGGETTVTIRGSGKGGRNQEMALSFLSELEKDRHWGEHMHFLAASTDGSDGPTDAAGAFASPEILRRAVANHINIDEYLKNNDSYHFFECVGGLLKTGPTNTNVCDVQILLIK